MSLIKNYDVPEWVRWAYDGEPVYDNDRRSYWIKHAENDWSLVTDEEMNEAECSLQIFHVRDNNLLKGEGTFLINTFIGTKPKTADQGTISLDSSSGDIYVFSGSEWVLLGPESGVTYIPQDTLVYVDNTGKLPSSFATMDGLN